jgi:diacylglycerol kinase
MWALPLASFVALIVSNVLLMSLECLNIALEKLCDFIAQGKYSSEIKKIKDVSAGAVLIYAIANVGITASIWVNFIL